MVDAAPEGLEVLRGNSSYIYNGNWKLQMENGADGYHVSSVHWNYAATMGHRSYDEAGTRAVDPDGWSRAWAASMPLRTGISCCGRNCSILKSGLSMPIARPWLSASGRSVPISSSADPQSGALSQRLSDGPVLDADPRRASDQREETEVTIYCFAPGESAAERTLRIRQYEDFFNVSGMGTPDDLEEFRACQSAYEGAGGLWNDLSRVRVVDCRPDANATAMGLEPILSGERSEDEGLFVRQHEFGPKCCARRSKPKLSKSKEPRHERHPDQPTRHRSDRGISLLRSPFARRAAVGRVADLL
jgi:benzoate/toluate 1,2-dioxygenase alpha subunit